MLGLSFRDSESRAMKIYSIGHSNQPIQAFLELLSKHGIQVLVDVRSHPYSRYVPHFNSPELAHAVGQAKVSYLFMGKELGGRPDGEEFYDAEDHVIYSLVAQSPLFLKGIERLEEVGKASRAAIMCSEEDPTACHRHLLIGRVLAERGISVLHIRGNGRIQMGEELASLEEAPLFEHSLWSEQWPASNDRGGREWRSIRSVSRRKQRPNSSDR
ncbi:MAG: DUF488 family protein [Ktedonobacteraceae bacterium]|jgi:uncharacterized protein (DUF488 family)